MKLGIWGRGRAICGCMRRSTGLVNFPENKLPIMIGVGVDWYTWTRNNPNGSKYKFPFWSRNYRPWPCTPVPEISSFDENFQSFRSNFHPVLEGSDSGGVKRQMMLQSKLKGDVRSIMRHLGVEWKKLRLQQPTYVHKKEHPSLDWTDPASVKNSSTTGKPLDIVRLVVVNLRMAGFHCDPAPPVEHRALEATRSYTTKFPYNRRWDKKKISVPHLHAGHEGIHDYWTVMIRKSWDHKR